MIPTTTTVPTKPYNTRRGKRCNYSHMANGLPSQETQSLQPELTTKRQCRSTTITTTTTEPITTTMTTTTIADNQPVETNEVEPPVVETPPTPSPTTVSQCIKMILNGEHVNLQLHELPEATLATTAFANQLHDKTNMFYCECCHERWINMKPSRNNNQKCEECAKDRNNPPTWSHLNDMDPFHPHGYPFHLLQLTQIEEMWIVRSHVVMVCMQVAGGNVQYRGNVLNTQQNSERIFEYVPLLPSDLPRHSQSRLYVKAFKTFKTFVC